MHRFRAAMSERRKRGRPAKYNTNSVSFSSVGGDDVGNRTGKDKDVEDYIHTVVLSSAKDYFLLCQVGYVAYVCGYFGQA